MKNLVIATLVLTLANVAAAQIQLFDDFDDSSIDTGLWSVAGSPVESGTLISFAGGQNIASIGSYTTDFVKLGLRNVYDSRSRIDYSQYTIGYAGFGNLLVRNDIGTYAGSLTVMSFVYPNWIPLTSLNIADFQTHDVDVTFEWTTSGLLISLDDLATGGLDVQSLITDPQYIPGNSGQVVCVGNTVLGGTWDLDYAQIGIPEPATMLLLGLGGLFAVKRRKA